VSPSLTSYTLISSVPELIINLFSSPEIPVTIRAFSSTDISAPPVESLESDGEMSDLKSLRFWEFGSVLFDLRISSPSDFAIGKTTKEKVKTKEIEAFPTKSHFLKLFDTCPE